MKGSDVMKIRIPFIISLVMSVLLTNCMSAGNISLEDLGLKKLADGTVDISTDINLNGNTLVLPSGVTLNFTNDGMLIGGSIDGRGTKIRQTGSPIFDDIVISGSWNVPVLSTTFFAKTDNNTLSNLSNMLSDSIHNTLRIDNPCNVPVDIAWGSRFVIKSNTNVVFNSDIRTLDTDVPGGYAMMVKGSNVNVTGNGHTMSGTIKVARKRNAIKQFLHGLFIDPTAENVTVNYLKAFYFCGDGFYTQGDNINFNGVTGRYNGRQGLSICGGNQIIVSNSTFTDTGKYGINESKGPGAGLDIEPSDKKVDNVLIENCTMKNNYRYMEGYVNDLEIYDSYAAKITVKNCSFNGLYLGNCSNVTIEDCRNIRTIFGVDGNVSNITITDSGRPRISPKIRAALSNSIR